MGSNPLPTVRSLEWNEPIQGMGIGDMIEAPALATGYRIYDAIAGRRRYRLYLLPHLQVGRYPTLREAKVSAQTHFRHAVAQELSATPILINKEG